MIQRPTVPRALPFILALGACGPQAPEEEEVRTFERRRPACEVFCGLVLDPECGSDVEIYEDEQECMDLCLSEDAEYWFLQDDGTDACGEEFTEYYACAAASPCESRWIITNVPAYIADTPCVETSEAYGDCQIEHLE
jgi:hypothetical protein